MDEQYEAQRVQLLQRIETSERRTYSPQIRTLMALFGFNANQRVRQSSLAEVTRLLTDRGIGHSFPHGTSSMDSIRLVPSSAPGE